MSTFPTDRTSRVILLSFMALIVLLIIMVVWLGWTNQRKELALAREVRTVETERPRSELRSCLRYELPLGKRWAESGTAISNMNHVTDLGVSLHDVGDTRKIVVTTRLGRALRPREVAAFARCGVNLR